MGLATKAHAGLRSLGRREEPPAVWLLILDQSAVSVTQGVGGPPRPGRVWKKAGMDVFKALGSEEELVSTGTPSKPRALAHISSLPDAAFPTSTQGPLAIYTGSLSASSFARTLVSSHTSRSAG